MEGSHVGGRSLGGTERSWCKAVPGGTGIATLGILASSELSPEFISRLENALKKLQNSHPVLKSRLRFNPSFSFVENDKPYLEVKVVCLSSTLEIIESISHHGDDLTEFQRLFEHELNVNSWADSEEEDVVFATIYELPASKKLVTLRLHVSACDRTTASTLLMTLRELMASAETETLGTGTGTEMETLNLAIEDLVPTGATRKSLWGRGVDVIGYSVDSYRLTNLPFMDTRFPRRTQVVRLQLSYEQTQKIISGCNARGIKLAGALAGAGLMAARRSKSTSTGKQRKYGVVTLTDCRSALRRPLSNQHFGFYHSAVMNTHTVTGNEKLWEVAERYHTAFAASKKSNKHFTDMADLNFLMCKAIDNPSLTPSSSQRTSLMSLFEDTVVDNSGDANRTVGVEDYMGCASVHGIGPTIGFFDTVRDGCLDCICVYPSPLHSRDQIVEFVGDMKRILELES